MDTNALFDPRPVVVHFDGTTSRGPCSHCELVSVDGDLMVQCAAPEACTTCQTCGTVIYSTKEPRGDTNMATTTEEYFTAEEIAAVLRVHSKTVIRLIQEGALPALKIGRAYRIKMSDVEQLHA